VSGWTEAAPDALPRAEGVPRSTWALVGLALALVVRMVIAGADGPASPASGLVFAALVATTAVCTGWRPPRLTRTVVATGCVGAGVLVVGPLAVKVTGFGLQPAPPVAGFPLWAAVVVAVAFSEEMVLRGPLFDDLEQRWGALWALGLTSMLFALLHFPLYGWRALPLDLAVGSVLGLLRLRTGSMAAPGIAHAAADLASWWLW